MNSYFQDALGDNSVLLRLFQKMVKNIGPDSLG